MWPEIALIVGAYLFGSFPLMDLMGRAAGVNLREEEDMHIALWRRVGRFQGTVGILGDFAKGAVPVLVARVIFDPLWVAGLAGLAAVIGQMWPVFLGFDGEKGNSTGLAMSFALAYQAALLILVPIVIGVAIRTLPRARAAPSWNERLRFGGPPSRSLPLAMGSAFALLPLLSWGLGGPLGVNLVFLGLFLAIMVRRLTAGLRKDLRQAQDKKRMLLNRFLYDRSFL